MFFSLIYFHFIFCICFHFVFILFSFCFLFLYLRLFLRLFVRFIECLRATTRLLVRRRLLLFPPTTIGCFSKYPNRSGGAKVCIFCGGDSDATRADSDATRAETPDGIGRTHSLIVSIRCYLF
jgi:hypothetical protein